jgi:MFS family permease
MSSSTEPEAGPVQYIARDHTTAQYAFILVSVSMCITVDILQYSMPLAFLPSVLEDRGHSTEMIATAIGVYYWTGLLGGICLTSYEVWKMLCSKTKHEVDITTYATVQKQLKVIIFNLGIGVITLFIQANCPRWHVHTACRFVQGFVGAFLFFYVFLLNVAVFRGQQQVIAMTCASCATVLAELAGPLLGSILFDAYGQRAVFWFLGVVSFINQGMLVGVLYATRATTDVGSAAPSRESSPMLSGPSPTSPITTPMLHDAGPDAAAGHVRMHVDESSGGLFTVQPGAWGKLKSLLSNPTFICANLIITMAGVIKGSVEEMLPFHADHQWGYDPLEIGKLFCTTAVAYFVASFIVAGLWTDLGRFQIAFSSQCVLLLGCLTWCSFHVAYYYKDETALYGTFAGYGFCAGLTFTSAAQLIADVVDRAEGHAKDAANGIWNTMWEFGGSSGFALGGFLAHHYHDQMNLTTWYLVCSFVVSACMIVVGRNEGAAGKIGGKDKLGYGAIA